MGKVVKSARFAEQKYVVGVPVVDTPPTSYSQESDDLFAGFAAAESSNGALHDEPLDDAVTRAQREIDWEALKADAEAIVDRAASDAEALLRQAESTALDLVSQAQARAAALEEEARRRGRDDGYAEGYDAGKAELEPVIATVRQMLEGITAQRTHVITAAEPELVRLAMAIAERIVHTEVANNREVVVENVRSALTRLVSREVVTLRVNPIDHETIRQFRDAIVAASDVAHLRVVEDQRVDRGGVVVETDAGTIDAKIATQLREAKRAILSEEGLALDSSPDEEFLHPSAQAG
jgi:flagellar assembly protein FliH